MTIITVFTQRHQLSVPLTPSKAASPHPVGMETDKKEERNQTLFSSQHTINSYYSNSFQKYEHLPLCCVLFAPWKTKDNMFKNIFLTMKVNGDQWISCTKNDKLK